MTIDRANTIAKAMGTNEAEVENLLSLAPEVAAEQLNAKGYDFTAQELVEFVEFVKANAVQEGEISEEQLDNVAGGVVAELVFCGGVLLGMYLNKKGYW